MGVFKMNPKIKWLRDKINMENMQGMIISNPVNIKYLTGIEAEGTLIIARKENFFLTDSRYLEEVQSVLTINDGIIVNDVASISRDDYENFSCFVKMWDLKKTILHMRCIKNILKDIR